jgi:hypothetical protein
MRFTAYRIAGLIFGVPILLLGSLEVVLDIVWAVGSALDQDPKHHKGSPFPLGVLLCTPLVFLGYRLVFTRPRPLAQLWTKRPVQTEPIRK